MYSMTFSATKKYRLPLYKVLDGTDRYALETKKKKAKVSKT